MVSEIRLCGTFDERFVRNRADGDGLFKEPVEEFTSAARFTPVEPEREFIQIGVQMLRAHSALVGSEQPELEQRDRQMNAWPQFRSSLAVSFQDATGQILGGIGCVLSEGGASDPGEYPFRGTGIPASSWRRA